MANRCIKNLLKLICLLQDNSENSNCLEEGCSKSFLGPNINCICYNTRVITIYNKNGSLFTTTYIDEDNVTQTSSLFRVERVLEDTCVLRILSEIDGDYVSTNNFITVNLGCICAIKCLDDVVIENL